MTLSEFITLAKAYRDLNSVATAQLDRVIGFDTEHGRLDGVESAVDWLRQVEGYSGNDDELADEVGGALSLLRGIAGMPEGSA